MSQQQSKESKQSLFRQMSEFIIKKVQDESSGFQLIVSLDEVKSEFESEIDSFLSNAILNALCKREEIAEVDIDEDGEFDIVLFTDYAPNYEEEKEDEE